MFLVVASDSCAVAVVFSELLLAVFVGVVVVVTQVAVEVHICHVADL